RPRVMAPLRRVGQDRVDVAEQDQHRPVALSVQRRHQVGSLGLGGQNLGVETGLAQVALQVLDGGPLVARRVDGVKADELLEERDALALEVVGRHRVSADYRRSMRAVPGAPDDLALALELADVADAITMARFRAEDLVVETKPDLTPVSEADRAVEQALREHLATRRPQDIVFGEEYGGGDHGDGAGRRWIVDPIDGTKGYVRRMQVWGTLLALEEDGEMTVGVVSAPAMGRRWWAARGACPGSGSFRTPRCASAATRSGGRPGAWTRSWRCQSAAGVPAATGISGSTCSSRRVPPRSPWTRRRR